MRTTCGERMQVNTGTNRFGRFAFFVFPLFLFLFFDLFFPGCKSSSPPSTSKPRPSPSEVRKEARWETLFKGDEESLKEFQEIQTELRSSNYANAVQRLEKLLKRSPDAAWKEVVQFQLAQTLKMTNDFPGALKQLDVFLKRYPESPEAPKAMFSKGEIFLQMAKNSMGGETITPLSRLHFDKAIRIFRQVQKENPEDRDIQAQAEYYIGTGCMAMKDFEKTRQALKKVSAEYEDTPYAAKALYMLAGVCLSEGDMDGAERTFGEITDRFPNTFYARKARQKLEGIGLVGYTAPPLQVKEWVGEPPPGIEKGYKGKTFLLNFWAIWCPHCKRNIPKMERLHKQYASEGLEVVGVSRERKGYEADKIREFIETHPISFPTAVDNDGKTSMSFLVTNVPRVVIVDSNGKIRWYGHPEYLTDAVIQKLLKGSS